MRLVSACTCLIAVAVAAPPALAPPSRPGAWTQVGRMQTVTGKPLHFFRTADYPEGLAVVVESSSARGFKVLWATDCEVFDDDVAETQDQGTASGVKRVVVYPPVLNAATRCYVWVNVTSPGKPVVRAAVFSS